MFSKLAAAAIAVSLIAGPAFAQNPVAAPVTTSQPAPNAKLAAPTAKVKETGTFTGQHRKHVAVNVHHRYHVKHVRIVKHVKHVKYTKHNVKHLKQVKHSVKSRIDG